MLRVVFASFRSLVVLCVVLLFCWCMAAYCCFECLHNVWLFCLCVFLFVLFALHVNRCVLRLSVC